MKKFWIAVANASELKIFASDGELYEEDTDVVFVQELKHPESRLKPFDFKGDKPGTYKTHDGDGSAYEQKTEIKEVEKIHFAEEINKLLTHAKNSNQYDQLLLIAPDHFYGILKMHLHHTIQDAIYKVISKDYTTFTTEELAKMIRKDINS